MMCSLVANTARCATLDSLCVAWKEQVGGKTGEGLTVCTQLGLKLTNQIAINMVNEVLPGKQIVHGVNFSPE